MLRIPGAFRWGGVLMGVAVCCAGCDLLDKLVKPSGVGSGMAGTWVIYQVNDSLPGSKGFRLDTGDYLKSGYLRFNNPDEGEVLAYYVVTDASGSGGSMKRAAGTFTYKVSSFGSHNEEKGSVTVRAYGKSASGTTLILNDNENKDYLWVDQWLIVGGLPIHVKMTLTR